MKKRRKKSRRGLVPAVILLAILAGAAVFFALFYVSNEDAEVLGNTRYKENEIRQIAMPGILDHNSLFLRFFRKSIETEDIAFLDSIDVEYIARNKVRLHVNEDYPIGFLLQDENRYYFDAAGLVIEGMEAPAETSQEAETEPAAKTEEETAKEEAAKEGTSKEEAAEEDGEEKTATVTLQAEAISSANTAFRPALTDVCQVTGLTEERVAVGEKIPAEDDAVFQTLLVVNKLISKLEVLPDMIEVGEENALTLHYGKTLIALGKDTLLEEKMSRAAAILPQIRGIDGVLHLEHYSSDTINIIFEQAKEETAETGKQGNDNVLDLVGIGTDRTDASEEGAAEESAEEEVQEEETGYEETGYEESGYEESGTEETWEETGQEETFEEETWAEETVPEEPAEEAEEPL